MIKGYVNGMLKAHEPTADELAQMEAANGRVKLEEASRSLSADEVFRLTIRKQVNGLSIPDATASRMVDYYPTLTDFDDGALIQAKTVINWNGVLKRAAVDLFNTETNIPDSAPTLWVDIAYKSGIRIAPETFTATNAAAMDELMWFGEHIYRSKMAGNVYTPEQAQNAWELVR